jgi:hypothetical protein
VVAAWLIAQRGVNTLVLVHRRQLQQQWIERLSTFLAIPVGTIGRIGGGRNKPTGLLDVAVIQSLVRNGVVDDLVGNYGHVIVDECHHLSAQSFELVCLGLPGINYADTCRMKVIHISSRHRHAVNKGGSRDESVTIGSRTGHVEPGAPLGNSSIDRKDATVERGQNMAIHPGSKNRSLFPVAPFEKEDSYLQFQY